MSDKNVIMSTANDIQEKISSMLVDVERSESLDNKLLKILPSSIRYISDNLKSLVKKIKILIRSQEDEITDIKHKINDYNPLFLELKNH